MFWEPFDEIARMHEEIDGRFGKMFSRGWFSDLPLLEPGKQVAPQRRYRMPLSDVQETENAVTARFELPGVDKNDIELNITDDFVEVKVEKKAEKEVKKKGFHSFESRAQQFYRRVPLPTQVEPGKAQAEYKDGVLRVEIPKLKKVLEKRKRIQIK